MEHDTFELASSGGFSDTVIHNYRGPFSIGFPFPWYERIVDRVWINRSGLIFFGDEPSIHKAHVLRQYQAFVPEFEEKSFGLAAWNDYLHADPIDAQGLPRTVEAYRRFLDAARACVRAHAD